jgi:hypothetical protein
MENYWKVTEGSADVSSVVALSHDIKTFGTKYKNNSLTQSGLAMKCNKELLRIMHF